MSSILLLAVNSAYGQIEIERILNSWNDLEWNAESSQILREQLERLLLEPISIQQRDPFILGNHPLISEMEAINISYHIQRSGAILDWHELNDITGIDENWIELRKPFLSLEPTSRRQAMSWTQIQSQLTLGFLAGYPKNKGQEENLFTGPDFQDQGKLKLSAGPFEAQLRWQRDMGEPFGNYLYDHINGFVLYNSRERHYSISLGSYHSGFGSGLLVGNSFMNGLPNEANQLHRRANRTQASAPGGELQHWAGVVGRWNNSKWNYLIACGYARRDARVENNEIQSFIQTGLHRTPTEIERRKNTRLYQTEAQIKFRTHSLIVSTYLGIQFLPQHFKNQSALGGLSAHLQWVLGGNHLQTEVSLNLQKQPAFMLSYTRSIHDIQIGGRVHYSSNRYTPMLQASNGVYFTGSGQVSREAFIGTSFRNNTVSLSGFFAKKHLEWLTKKEKRGLQLNFQRRNGSDQLTSRLNFQSRENEQLLYGKIHLRTSLSTSQLTIGTHIHHNLKGKCSHLIQIGFEKEFTQFKFRSRFTYHSSHSSQLPLYSTTLSTSLQMRILRLSGSGTVLDLWLELPITKRWKIQCSVLYDSKLNLDKRGSGLNETPGSDKWILSTEIHCRLGKL